MNKVALDERFWSKVQKSDDCWEWTAYKDSWGYGIFGYKGKTVRAHRHSYLAYFGPYNNELLVCHSCDNPACVRPDHLFLGTNQDNAQDAVQKNRTAYGPRNHKTKLTEKEVLDIVNLWRQGVPRKIISQRFNIDASVVTRIMSGQCWRRLTGIVTGEQSAHFGEKHLFAKLTDEQVTEIRRKRNEEQQTLRVLAQEYGVRESTISRIANHQRRKELAFE